MVEHFDPGGGESGSPDLGEPRRQTRGLERTSEPCRIRIAAAASMREPRNTVWIGSLEQCDSGRTAFGAFPATGGRLRKK